MHIAICLFKYFPFGGLQRDFARIARACLAQGYAVTVYTTTWQGPVMPGVALKILPVTNWYNHRRNQAFVRQLGQELRRDPPDLVIGFNKIPYLDIYYAADSCYRSKLHQRSPWWYRYLPRYRAYLRAEQLALGNPGLHIAFLSTAQCRDYCSNYQLAPERCHILAPSLNSLRLPGPDTQALRQQFRARHNIKLQHTIMLAIASSFKTKGLARIIAGMAALSPALQATTQLWVVGQDNPAQFIKYARQLHVQSALRFWGGQEDIAPFLAAADLFVHPAYEENTGLVLLEALAYDLPILTVARCGYAPYVQEWAAGIVLPEQFDQTEFNHHLAAMLEPSYRALWHGKGSQFIAQHDPELATCQFMDLVAAIAKQRSS